MSPITEAKDPCAQHTNCKWHDLWQVAQDRILELEGVVATLRRGIAELEEAVAAQQQRDLVEDQRRRMLNSILVSSMRASTPQSEPPREGFSHARASVDIECSEGEDDDEAMPPEGEA